MSKNIVKRVAPRKTHLPATLINSLTSDEYDLQRWALALGVHGPDRVIADVTRAVEAEEGPPSDEIAREEIRQIADEKMAAWEEYLYDTDGNRDYRPSVRVDEPGTAPLYPLLETSRDAREAHADRARAGLQKIDDRNAARIARALENPMRIRKGRQAHRA